MLVSLALVMGVGPVQGWSTPPDGKAASSPATPPRVAQGPQLAAADPTALGVSFVEGSSSSVIIERNGKKYLLDLATQTVREVTGSQDAPAGAKKLSADPAQKAQAGPPTPPPEQKTKPGVYEPGDDFVFSLPTGRRLNRHGFYINFNHRFAFNPAFEGKARGHVLLGLDDFSISSFGFRYGVTKDLSVGVYRSPSVIGRPIQFTAGYHLLDEHDGGPFNAEVRVSVEGQNDFSKNFTGDFEGIFSRSLTGRAQIYIVPTFSVQNRPLVPPQRVIEDPWPNLPGFNTFALGVGGSLDIRPTVALVAEVIPTLVNGPELGIHRPAYSFGIQKKIWRHAFTFGFTTSPGTTVSQRAATRAALVGDPTGDTPGGLFVGFDLTRQVY
ncbi:MAG: DUF5777 family beta-barrel protein [Acidobacteriia bacterium]|nr:DUF5777 family beta-barrel protein [Terriglobia bacterium]